MVNECHVVLNSGVASEWRFRMLKLRKLIRAETQLVYLTAILRPANEKKFEILVGLPAREMHWFRGSTTRRNVRYQIQRYPTPEEKKKRISGINGKKKAAIYGADYRVL
jgi:superfamily II DNA helicase RecQ